MALYSFVVIAQQPSGLLDPMVMLDKGVNVFTAEVANLEDFKLQMEAEGVEVTQVNRLDDFESFMSTDPQLDAPLTFDEGSDGEFEI